MQTRRVGPDAPGGFPTFSGVAGNKPVHWIGLEEKRADKLEEKFAKASPLLRLLLCNAYTLERLTAEEIHEARNLIETEPETAATCGAGCLSKAIGDTGICRGHNRYALEYRV